MFLWLCLMHLSKLAFVEQTVSTVLEQAHFARCGRSRTAHWNRLLQRRFHCAVRQGGMCKLRSQRLRAEKGTALACALESANEFLRLARVLTSVRSATI